MNRHLLSITSLIIALLSPLTSFSQDDPLIEEFDDNSRGWIAEEERDDRYVEFSDGILFFENLNLDPNTSKFSAIRVQIDTDRAFSIEMRTRFVSGADDRRFGITWDRGGNSFRRDFGISGNQWYLAAQHDGKDWSYPIQWTKAPEIVRANDFNELAIRKIGKTAYYLINEQIVGRQDIEKFYGDRLGFVIPAGTAIEVDWLRVTYPKQSAKELAHLAESYESALRNRRIAAAGPVVELNESFDSDDGGWDWLEFQTAEFRNGRFYWESNHPKKRNMGIRRLDFSVNEVADFRIEMKVRNAGGAEDYPIGFKWAGDNKEAFEFSIAFDGHFRYSAGKNDDQRIPWTKTSAVDSKGWNRLAARKIDESIFLFINDQLVAVRRATERFGPYFTLINGFGLKVEIDDLQVTYPEQTTAERQKEKQGYIDYLVENRLEYRRDGIWIEPPFMVKARLRDDFNADKKIQRALDRFKKRYRNKTLAHIIADHGQPVEVRQPFHYFRLGNVGQMSWYVRVSAINLPGKPRNNDPRNHAVQDSMAVVSSYELFDQP